MDSLREFFVSSSGLAPARQGLELGWVISALTGVAILLSPRGAAACHSPWTEFGGYSSSCDSKTNGARACKERTCWADEDCENVECDHWDCVVC